MKIFQTLFLTFSLLFLLSACDSWRRLSKNSHMRQNGASLKPDTLVHDENEVAVGFEDGDIPNNGSYPLRPTPTRKNDILHTRIDLRFDWKNRWALGKAWLTVTPYFYPVNAIELDAKSFTFHQVALIDKAGNRKDLLYTYNRQTYKVNISLDKMYAVKDTYTLFIDYTAKPYEMEASGGSAVTSDRGLFFINHDGKTPETPQQIWTQGETTWNSAWFPTFDHPSEKMTEEIALTVENRFITVSNGTKVKEVKNADGTRTDFWKQEKPHSVYLFAFAVGEFGEYKDKWRGKEVNYYMEKKFAPYAKAVFGNTPEMIEFYSNLLKVEYPWEKYSEIVVREFVSGAMENTGCVIFYDALNETDREMLDKSHDDIISHELFHHWFGDLVTCENYGQLALNESFASYAEYLWFAHKYGKDAADSHLFSDLQSYLMEASYKRVPIIRYRYNKDDDMFDGHSYQKGACVLHMLRNYIGDAAFFAALHEYLVKYSYQNTEIHDLRMAFEHTTGEDLNWFFNQWFLSPGHPKIEYGFTNTGGQLKVKVTQKQSGVGVPVFRIFNTIQVVDMSGKKYLFPVEMNTRDTTYVFSLTGSSKVASVVWDGEGAQLAEITNLNEITVSDMELQYLNSHAFRPRTDALLFISANQENNKMESVLRKSLQDSFWENRVMGMVGLEAITSPDEKGLATIISTYTNDSISGVRAGAMQYFTADKFNTQKKNPEFLSLVQPMIEKGLTDKSYLVLDAAFKLAKFWIPEKAKKYAYELPPSESGMFFQVMDYLMLENSPESIDKCMEMIQHAPETKDRFYAIAYNLPQFYAQGKAKTGQDKIMRKMIFMAENDPSKEVRIASMKLLASQHSKHGEVIRFFTKALPPETDKDVQDMHHTLKGQILPK